MPVFIVALGLTRLLVAGLEAAGSPRCDLCCCFSYCCLPVFSSLRSCGSEISPDKVITILAGMLGVSAMAVQNAMVVMSLKDSPSTAVMTTNITRFVMDVGDVLLRNDRDEVAEASRRARHTFPAIIGFAGGAGSGGVLCGGRAVVPDAAHRPRPARGCDGFCDEARWRRAFDGPDRTVTMRVAIQG